MKLKNLNFGKDWKTTVTAIVGGMLVLAGILWPSKIDPETQASANTAIAQVLAGVGTLVALIAGLFGSDGVET